MCDTCNCDAGAAATFSRPGQDHDHGHHHHDHDHPHARTVHLEAEVLGRNREIAAANREMLRARDVVALNLVSSPGSGKTTILERTIRDLDGEFPLAVIEGDQQTLRDAERIAATGAEVLQVNTGAGCHLDAAMIASALQRMKIEDRSLLFIENVGNLVCPAMFDLGEEAKVVIISVTEGEDKPLKYPHMFRAATLCLINKVDLLPHLRFDVGACRKMASQVNPELSFLEVSAYTGEGMEEWYGWLRRRLKAARS